MPVVVPTPELLAQFNRDGFLVLPDVLSPEEVTTLRNGLERVFNQHSPEADIYHMQDIWRPKMFEHGEAFEKLIDHPGIADFAEAYADQTERDHAAMVDAWQRGLLA